MITAEFFNPAEAKSEKDAVVASLAVAPANHTAACALVGGSVRCVLQQKDATDFDNARECHQDDWQHEGELDEHSAIAASLRIAVFACA